MPRTWTLVMYGESTDPETLTTSEHYSDCLDRARCVRAHFERSCGGMVITRYNGRRWEFSQLFRDSEGFETGERFYGTLQINCNGEGP